MPNMSPPPKALLFSGGAEYGFAYIGVYRFLYERGMMEGVEAFYGASVGAIFATLISIGYTPRELEFLLSRLDTKRLFPDTDTNVLDLLEHSGFIEPQRLYKFLHMLIDIKIRGRGDVSEATFTEHYERFKKRLVIVGTSLTLHAPVYFSAETHPTMSIITALKISTAVPFVFRPVSYEDSTYLDGSITDNFPLQYALNRYSIDDILGVFLHSGNSRIFRDDPDDEHSLGQFGVFLKHLMQTLYYKIMFSTPYRASFKNLRCIEVAFREMKQGATSLFNGNGVLAEYVEIGYNATSDYFSGSDADDVPPPPPPAEPKPDIIHGNQRIKIDTSVYDMYLGSKPNHSPTSSE